jgi:hypothetical protein
LTFPVFVPTVAEPRFAVTFSFPATRESGNGYVTVSESVTSCANVAVGSQSIGAPEDPLETPPLVDDEPVNVKPLAGVACRRRPPTAA